MVYNVIIAMMQKWFPDKKGLATGITLAILGDSATILSPLCNKWLVAYGLAGTFKILTGIFVVIAIFGMLTIKAPPEGYMSDYRPTGAVRRLIPPVLHRRGVFQDERILYANRYLFLCHPCFCSLEFDLCELRYFEGAVLRASRYRC